MKVHIDVSDIETPAQLHRLLKEKLGFPDFYGNNWHAFWDAITGLVMMPDQLVFSGWSALEKRMPEDCAIMKEQLVCFYQDHAHWYGDDLGSILIGMDVKEKKTFPLRHVLHDICAKFLPHNSAFFK